MRRTGILSLLALATTLSLATHASAMTFGGEVYGAFNTYSMKDWNDAIDASNSGGSDFNNVNNGFTGGLDLRSWANPNWLFAAGWEPIFLTTEDKSASNNGKLEFNANAFTATGAYFFPTGSKGKYGIGAGAGYYSVNGKASGTGTSVDLKGNTVGFHFLGLGEWTMSPGFAVTAGAGYRIAKVDELKANGAVVTSGGSPIETDYSGFLGRVGLAFYLPSGSGQ